jgi:hypothetical protein
MAAMSGQEDWLLRPVLRGMCRMESVHGTELDLHDFAMMNEAIDVFEENQMRVQERQSRGG